MARSLADTEDIAKTGAAYLSTTGTLRTEPVVDLILMILILFVLTENGLRILVDPNNPILQLASHINRKQCSDHEIT
jgi:hypothetical protein